MTKLIIAEKYKTAQPFAKAVKATEKHITQNKGNVGYLEGNGWVVTWCAGHVISMDMPDSYDEKYKRWSLDDLPFIPENNKWKYHPSTQEPAKSQWKVLKELINRSDIQEIYHAADADREGEMIVREILREAKAPKNCKYYRLWYTNTTDAAVQRALQEAKPLKDYKALGDAADCRQKLDWIYGLNLTRGYTVYAHSVQNVGRVVSPTINLIVEKQKEIDSFVPQEYAKVTLTCVNDDNETFTAEAKFLDIPEGEAAAKRAKGADATIEKVEKTVEKEKRKLFNTTQLQAEASKRFGYEPEATMKILQDLYDAGYISYPRTKSNSINDDQITETQELPSLAYEKVFVNPKMITTDDFDIMRIVDKKGKGAEEASHTGLLPTNVGINSYQTSIKNNERNRNIFLLISSRMISSVLPDRVLDKVKVDVRVTTDLYKASGSSEREAGFAEFERYINSALKNKETKQKTEQVLPNMNEGDIYKVSKVKNEKKKTTPPNQYTTAQLLTTMENISRLVDDKKMKEKLKDAGLGTAASRDTIIKTIKTNGFVEIKAGKLYPTEKAKKLMALLPEDLKSPIMTGKMEIELDEIARGDGDPKKFIENISNRVELEINNIRSLKPIPDTDRYKDNKTFVAHACPKCGGDIVETDKSFVCKDNCGFIMWRAVASKKIPKTVFKELLENGHSSQKIDGFKSKAGKKFACWLYIDGTLKIVFDFDDNGYKAKNENIIALRNKNKKK